MSLAQPQFVLRRKAGGKLHFAVRVPGADKHVRVAIKLGNETLAKGFVNERGRFFKTIVKPSRHGQPARGGFRAGRGYRHLARRSRSAGSRHVPRDAVCLAARVGST